MSTGQHTDPRYIPPSGKRLPPVKPVDRSKAKRVKRQEQTQ